MVPGKGLAQLIEAMAILRDEALNCRLEIAGAGPELENLRKQVLRHELSEYVQFIGWQEDLGLVLKEWDIFAVPSCDDEGFGIVALEAMMEGLPVVATSVGGLPEIVEDARTGFLVPPHNPTAFARQLRRLINDPCYRLALGVAAHNRACALFSAEQMVAQIEKIYKTIVSTN
jgi:glycosyltransferase involved in cell wall biosynthesis